MPIACIVLVAVLGLCCGVAAITVPQTTLHDGTPIPQLIMGTWQSTKAFSGDAWEPNEEELLDDMISLVGMGITAFDLNNRHPSMVNTFSRFRHRLFMRRGSDTLRAIPTIITWIPTPQTKPAPQVAAQATPATVLSTTASSLRSDVQSHLRTLGVEHVDVLQLHWWDYDEHVEMMSMAQQILSLQREGLVRSFAVTNFDTPNLRRLVDSGVNVVANVVVYSVIDRRAQKTMTDFCLQHNITLVAYGTLMGGLLSDKYFGTSEPTSEEQARSMSLSRYMASVSKFGGWDKFQAVLRRLRVVARRHKVSIASVAIRYVLSQPAVGAVIVGARLGLASQLTTRKSGVLQMQQNLEAFTFDLSASDLDTIDKALRKAKPFGLCTVKAGVALPCDCGDELRSCSVIKMFYV